MKKIIVLMLVGLVAVAVELTRPTDAKALTFDLGSVFNGVTPTSTPPWLTATFADVTIGTVTLTLTSKLNVTSEFISDVAFNVNPSILPSSLTIVQSPIVNPIPTSILHTTDNAQNLIGGGAAGFGFDIMMSWATANNSGRFDDSDVVAFTITAPNLTAADFDFTNTGSADAKIGAHIQGIPIIGDGTTSGAIKDGGGAPVPEPATMFLLGLGLIGIAGYGRKTFLKK